MSFKEVQKVSYTFDGFCDGVLEHKEHLKGFVSRLPYHAHPLVTRKGVLGVDDPWFVTIASEHMTSRREWFITFEEVPEGNWTVREVDGSQHWVRGRGSIKIQRLSGLGAFRNRKWEEDVLENVLYVPALRKNLFSVHQATEQGYSEVHCGNQIFVMVHSAGKRTLTGYKGHEGDELFKLDMKAVDKSASESTKAAKAVETSQSTENIEASVVLIDLIQDRRLYTCQHDGCCRTFKNPQTLKFHHKRHCRDASAGNKEVLIELPTLTDSTKAGHNKKIPSKCPKCEKTFAGSVVLKRHYARKHSEGEKSFGCCKCGKKFYLKVDMRDHERLCGVSFECKCGRKFASNSNLVTHKKAHPACQDQSTNYSPADSNNQETSSKYSEQNLRSFCTVCAAGTS